MRVSSVKRLGTVPFPSFTVGRVYMQRFAKACGDRPSGRARGGHPYEARTPRWWPMVRYGWRALSFVGG